MDEYESLSHTTWDCKYHVVFIPKCRRRTLYQELRRHLGEVFRRLALQKELKVEEGHLMPDHVHMLLSIPPKHAVSQVVGYIKGKSAIHMARVYGERKRNFVGQHFWARGFFVNTVGRDEEAIRAYIRTHWRAIDELDERQPHPQAVRTFAPSNRRTFSPWRKGALEGWPPSLRQTLPLCFGMMRGGRFRPLSQKSPSNSRSLHFRPTKPHQSPVETCEHDST